MADVDDNGEAPSRHSHAPPSWGFVAAMTTDKVIMQQLLEEGEDYVNPEHVESARRLLRRVMYGAHRGGRGCVLSSGRKAGG